MNKFMTLLAAAAMIAMAVAGFSPADASAAETRIIIDGSTTVGPIAKAFAEYYMSLHPDVNVTVSESGEVQADFAVE